MDTRKTLKVSVETADLLKEVTNMLKAQGKANNIDSVLQLVLQLVLQENVCTTNVVQNEKSVLQNYENCSTNVVQNKICSTSVVQEGGHFVLQNDFDLEIKEIKNAYNYLKDAFGRLSNDFDDLESRVTVN